MLILTGRSRKCLKVAYLSTLNERANWLISIEFSHFHLVNAERWKYAENEKAMKTQVIINF
jgi:hypothetical protein